MKLILLFLLSCTTALNLTAQTEDSKDSVITGNLAEVVVKAFEQNKRLKDVPAAISYFGATSLDRYNNTNILPALNAAPGIRMEERSPGSYRLNIRGSSLRAPFGVRNVKVYYNAIPYTDPGGNTYLNQLGFYNFQNIEIIKGPGSSLYGSGTGGVMLIGSTPNNWSRGLDVNYTTGSYNLQNISAIVRVGLDSFRNTITFQHQTSDGYRVHSNLRRDVLGWNTVVKGGINNQLTANFLYGDLYYQTPGALTLAEYNADPKAARPGANGVPGAAENSAAIFQKAFLAGATYRMALSNSWQNTSVAYGAFTQLKNPTIRNYGRSNEPHFGGRTTFQYSRLFAGLEVIWHTGAELQQGLTTVQIHNNVRGNPDSLQTNDELNNRQAFVFTQLSLQSKGWVVTGGLSLNQLRVRITRLSNFPVTTQERKYNNEIAPRLAVLRKINEEISVYSSVSKGFSPPTSAEVLPGNGTINTSLNAEHGINYEAGLRGSLLKGQLNFDINGFLFRLNNTIVQRRDVTGGDYFINAGSTKQNGWENFISYQPELSAFSFVSRAKFWLSYTLNNFHYNEFKQTTNDYGGSQLPGIARNTIAGGADLVSRVGVYFNINYFYSDPSPLNDANLEWASSYNLLGGRAGYKTILKKGYTLEVFTAADNLFNVKYSLGNDLNAFGGRYYNAAPGRNYSVGISFGYTQVK